jgi:ABC-type phosphate transport system permease subunit
MIYRRQFLSRLTIVLGGLTGAIISLPVIGFFFAPLLRKVPRLWRHRCRGLGSRPRRQPG